MAKIIDHPTMYHSVPDDTDKKQYIETFDTLDDPMVFTVSRTSDYSLESTICGVFNSADAVIIRLKRLLECPVRDGEKYIIETHTLRDMQKEEGLN